MRFEKVYHESAYMLAEGSIVERIKKEFKVRLNQYINHSGLIYDRPDLLEAVYRQYIDIGQKYQLPMMIMTPTRRATHENLNKTSYKNKPLIQDACEFLNKIRNSYGNYADQIFIGGLLGCRGDAYSGKKVMEIEEAYEFHKLQTQEFGKQNTCIGQSRNIDYLFAAIMPEINEAIGLAKAMTETGIPGIISFMLRKDGCLLDGTYLSDAIWIIDDVVDPRPFTYVTNCIHPSNLISALKHEKNRNSENIKRFTGIQANSSSLSPEELDNCNNLLQDDFESMAEEMIYLHKHFNLKMLGGCCGTNEKFIELLASRLVSF